MQTPPEITFRHCEASDDMRSEIAAQMQRLARFGDRITSCRIVITGPGNHHRTGAPYKAELIIALPGRKEIVVSRHNAPEREHPRVAIREAFHEAIRQLEDVTTEMRDEAKE